MKACTSLQLCAALMLICQTSTLGHGDRKHSTSSHSIFRSFSPRRVRKRQVNLYLQGGYQSLLGPRRQEPYCAGRRDPNSGRFLPCCRGRNDACKMPFHDTSCYCDEFCFRSKSSDCCPDYGDYCPRAGFLITTTPAPTRIRPTTATTTPKTTRPTPVSTSASTVYTTQTDAAQEVCYDDGDGYKLGDKIKRNCNDCVCKRIIDGYYTFVCEENTCLVLPSLINVINQGQFGWTAGNYSFLWGLTLSQGIRFRLGTKRAPEVKHDTYIIYD